MKPENTFERIVEKMGDGRALLLMLLSSSFAVFVQLSIWTRMLSLNGFFVATFFGALAWLSSFYALVVLIGD